MLRDGSPQFSARIFSKTSNHLPNCRPMFRLCRCPFFRYLFATVLAGLQQSEEFPNKSLLRILNCWVKWSDDALSMHYRRIDLEYHSENYGSVKTMWNKWDYISDGFWWNDVFSWIFCDLIPKGLWPPPQQLRDLSPLQQVPCPLLQQQWPLQQQTNNI